MTPRTREWLRKADADRMVAARQFALRPSAHDIVCFHCQQAVEKYLKALLHELGQPIPKTHDLERLLQLLQAQVVAVLPLRRIVRGLSKYAADYRYPGLNATK